MRFCQKNIFSNSSTEHIFKSVKTYSVDHISWFVHTKFHGSIENSCRTWYKTFWKKSISIRITFFVTAVNYSFKTFYIFSTLFDLFCSSTEFLFIYPRCFIHHSDRCNQPNTISNESIVCLNKNGSLLSLWLNHSKIC